MKPSSRDTIPLAAKIVLCGLLVFGLVAVAQATQIGDQVSFFTGVLWVKYINGNVWVDQNSTTDLQYSVDLVRAAGAGKINLPCGLWDITKMINMSGLSRTDFGGQGACTILKWDLANYSDGTGNFNKVLGHRTTGPGMHDVSIHDLHFIKNISAADTAGHDNDGMISITNGDASNINIYNILIEANQTSVHSENSPIDYSTKYGIQLARINGGHLHDIVIRENGYYPIELERVQDFTTDHVYITTGYYGITGGTGDNRRLTFDDISILPRSNANDLTTCIEMESGSGEVVMNNIYCVNATGTAGIRFDNGIQDDNDHFSATNLQVIHADRALDIQKYDTVSVTNSHFPASQREMLFTDIKVLDFAGNTGSISFILTNVTNMTHRVDGTLNVFARTGECMVAGTYGCVLWQNATCSWMTSPSGNSSVGACD